MVREMVFIGMNISRDEELVSNGVVQFVGLLAMWITNKDTRFSTWIKFGTPRFGSGSKAQAAKGP